MSILGGLGVCHAANRGWELGDTTVMPASGVSLRNIETFEGYDMMDRHIRDSRQVRVGIAMLLTLGLLAAGPSALAAGPPPVGLGTAASFAVLAGTPAVTNTGATNITGNLGISPAAAVTGFPPGLVSGTIHKADAVALQAKNDLVSAYTDAAGRPASATHGTLGGLTLVSGVYTAGGVTLDLTGTLTLDGQNDPTSVWVFQATSDLVTASSSSVNLINGASACNVFWMVTSSATLGSGSTMVGTILALTSITMNNGVTLTGRALARNGQVTLISDTINNAACSNTTGTGPTTPPTDTVATTVAPGPGTVPLALVGAALLFLVVAVGYILRRRAGAE